MRNSHLVLVYGTLREGMSNSRLLQGSTKVLDMNLNNFKMYDVGAFPCVVPAENKTGIYVEMYEVNRSTLQRLDHLEGVPNMYRREVVAQCDIGYGNQDVYMYIWNSGTERMNEIPDGDYVQYIQQKRGGSNA